MRNWLSKYTLLTVILVFITGSSEILAQEGTITVGPGLAYGSEVENLGIKVDGYYTINEEFRAGLDLVYYFPETVGNTDINYFGFNINGHYIFYNEEEITAYGLAGINILRVKAESGNNSATDSESGLNLGAGIEYAQDFGTLFGELKLAGLGGDADQFVVGAGVRFAIN